MPKTPHVAILLNSGRSHDRGLLRGIARYVNFYGRWVSLRPAAFFERFSGLVKQDLAELRRSRLHGIITNDTPAARRFAGLGIPMVVVPHSRPFPGAIHLWGDNQPVAALAAEHLKELGLDSYAFVGRSATLDATGGGMRTSVTGIAAREFRHPPCYWEEFAMKTCLRTLALVLLGIFVSSATSSGEVVGLRIDHCRPFADGHAFGESGAYETVAGRLLFEVDPDAPANAQIADLRLAPRNEAGKVEFWADFFLLKPVDPAKGNGRLLYDVHNRGNKLALWTFNDAERTNEPATMAHAGNGFLLRKGYSLLWTGWNGDVVGDGTGRLLAGLPVAVNPDGSPITGKTYVEISVDEEAKSRAFYQSPWGTPASYPTVSLDDPAAMLTMRPTRKEPPVDVPRDAWAFARFDDGQIIPDPRSLYVKAGLRPGWLYELVYTARDPRVSGLGMAGLRDAVSFFRYADGDRSGTANPVRKAIDRAYIFGVSQSGRLAHQFLYEGLNLDSSDRCIFDGALVHVAGAGKGRFNKRFGMATVFGTYHRDNLAGTDFFPFTPGIHADPVTGQTGDSLARLRQKGEIPKIMFVQTSTEYWSRGASLLHTDVEGKRDLTLDPNVRIYFVAGAQHLGGGPTDRGICQNPRNPLRDRGPVLRALLTALDGWVSDGAEPPASRYPRIDDGTLVDLAAFQSQFPKIPDVRLPQDYYRPLRLDFGPRWESEGIATIVPPKVGPAYQTLVPAVDRDGNERAGIRLPDVAVPLATYTGWNLRADEYGVGGVLTALDGSYLEFPKTSAEQRQSRDPRSTIQSRYPTRESYLEEYAAAANCLLEDRFLLEEDVREMLEEAGRREYWGNP